MKETETMVQKIKKFFQWIWCECKDRRTVVLLLAVVIVMYLPVWGGYLLHAVFGWKWCYAVASAVLVFWAGPFTPFFPICIAITLSIKKAVSKYRSKKICKETVVVDETDNLSTQLQINSQNKKSTDKDKISYDELFWLFMSGSIAGVVIEGLFCLLTKGHWESHVVSVFGAFNILYGVGAVFFYVGAAKLKNRHIVTRVLIMATAATTLELLCGLLLKYGLGMRAWNYENSFLNFQGIICIGFSLIWGVAAFSFCKLYPFISTILSKLKRKKLRIACGVLTVFMTFNLCFTSLAIFRWSERHYNVTADSKLQKYLDYDTPDEWMQSRFVEWEFLNEND